MQTEEEGMRYESDNEFSVKEFSGSGRGRRADAI